MYPKIWPNTGKTPHCASLLLRPYFSVFSCLEVTAFVGSRAKSLRSRDRGDYAEVLNTSQASKAKTRKVGIKNTKTFTRFFCVSEKVPANIFQFSYSMDFCDEDIVRNVTLRAVGGNVPSQVRLRVCI